MFANSRKSWKACWADGRRKSSRSRLPGFHRCRNFHPHPFLQKITPPRRIMTVCRAFEMSISAALGAVRAESQNHPLPPKKPVFQVRFRVVEIDNTCTIKHLSRILTERTVIQMVIKDPQKTAVFELGTPFSCSNRAQTPAFLRVLNGRMTSKSAPSQQTRKLIAGS